MNKDGEDNKQQYKIEHLGVINNDDKILKEGKKFKINFIGDIGVGKTSISMKTVNPKFNVKDTTIYNPTINIDISYCAMKINEKILTLMVWDCCGQEKFCSLTPSLFKGTSIVCIVYAINYKKSFESVVKWLNIIRNQCNDPTVIVNLVENKCDFEDEKQVSREEGEEMKLKYNFIFLMKYHLKVDLILEI